MTRAEPEGLAPGDTQGRIAAAAADGRAWQAMASLLMLGAGAAWLLPPAATALLDWQPGRSAGPLAIEPWRLWTAALLHLSPAHLLINLGGALLLALLGRTVALPGRAAAAWALAWPLTQLGLDAAHAGGLGAPLPHYAGLSGVLHAGAAVLVLHLVWPGRPPALPPAAQARERVIGAVLGAALLAKLVAEQPWQAALPTDALLGIRTVPLAHSAGVLAGVLAWGLLAAAGRLSPARQGGQTARA